VQVIYQIKIGKIVDGLYWASAGMEKIFTKSTVSLNAALDKPLLNIKQAKHLLLFFI
jgi:hypothetical protein